MIWSDLICFFPFQNASGIFKNDSKSSSNRSTQNESENWKLYFLQSASMNFISSYYFVWLFLIFDLNSCLVLKIYFEVVKWYEKLNDELKKWHFLSSPRKLFSGHLVISNENKNSFLKKLFFCQCSVSRKVKITS